MVTIEDNRSRQERRAIATRTVTPEQLGLAGAHQLAQVQRTRYCPGAAFVAEHLTNPAALAAQLASPTDDLAKSLRAALPAQIRQQLTPPNGTELDQEVPAALVRALNKVAKGPSLWNPVRFPDSSLSDPTQAFRSQHPHPQGNQLVRFNRLLLRDAYPQALDTQPQPEFDWLATSRERAQMGAEAFLGHNRQYWGIENGTHQRLDCSALEDRLRIHDPKVIEILGFFHRVSLSLFVAWADQQPKVRDRTYPTWQAKRQAHRWSTIHQVTGTPT